MVLPQCNCKILNDDFGKIDYRLQVLHTVTLFSCPRVLVYKSLQSFLQVRNPFHTVHNSCHVKMDNYCMLHHKF